ncbi:MAG: hypothetical protein OXI50_10105 [Gammaproteobacteria bacterium]|nr:hypothetical protein [Gammaproteobacteria bacterium]
MAEEMNGNGADATAEGGMEDPAASLGSMVLNVRYLAGAVGALFVAGVISSYFGFWVGADVQGDFDTIIGAALASLADGLLVGAGILVAVGALVAAYRFDNREHR